ncbi:MAG: efflux RND transporter periplasmic adaptor subunit [Halioglobus sp.]
MNKKALYPLLALAACLGVATLVMVSKPTLEPEPYQAQPITVRVTIVKAKTEHLVIKSQGTVQPRSQTELIPEVSGRVTWISPALVDGGSFDAGELLLRIDDADYDNAVQRITARVDRTDVEADFAKDELQRLQRLHDQQLASQSQLDSAKRASRVAAANLVESRADLDQAKRDLERTNLVAPFKGLVREEHVDQGQFIARGNSIGTIYATDFVEVRLPIAPDQMAYVGLPVVRRGQIPADIRPPVTATAVFGSIKLEWTGELIRTEAQIDERSRMGYGVARFKNMASETEQTISAPVGLFVQASIRGREVEQVVRLPRSVIRDNNQVLIVDEDNRLHFREVSILRLEHDEVLIDAGLEDGERVCLSPMQTVVEGMRVQPVFE